MVSTGRGDTNRLKVATDQFSLVADSVLKLHPESGDLARALSKSIEVTACSGEAPTPALAMEVATAVLYLEAAYEDMDPTEVNMAERSASLAKRLDHVNAGGQPEGWMEVLTAGVSDRHTMGSVVDELRATLGGVEKSLDAFFAIQLTNFRCMKFQVNWRRCVVCFLFWVSIRLHWQLCACVAVSRSFWLTTSMQRQRAREYLKNWATVWEPLAF